MHSLKCWVFSLSLGAMALSGCSQSSVRTVVQRDGSFARHIEWQASSGQIEGEGKPADPRKAFVLPDKNRWKLKRRIEDSYTYFNGQRTFAAGEVSRGDVAVKGKVNGQNKVLLSNEVFFRKIGPDVWQYREVLRWVAGPTPRGKDWEALDDRKLTALVQRALPPNGFAASEARRLAGRIRHAMLLSLFGPPRPVLTEVFTHTDLALSHWQLQTGRQIDAIMKAQFGQRLTAAQRFRITRRILVPLFEDIESKKNQHLSQTKTTTQTKAKPTQKSDNLSVEEFTSLTFRLRLPGKLVSTNGEINPYSGEITWGLFPQAAQLGEVVLLATTRLTP